MSPERFSSIKEISISKPEIRSSTTLIDTKIKPSNPQYSKTKQENSPSENPGLTNYSNFPLRKVLSTTQKPFHNKAKNRYYMKSKRISQKDSELSCQEPSSSFNFNQSTHLAQKNTRFSSNLFEISQFLQNNHSHQVISKSLEKNKKLTSLKKMNEKDLNDEGIKEEGTKDEDIKDEEGPKVEKYAKDQKGKRELDLSKTGMFEGRTGFGGAGPINGRIQQIVAKFFREN